MQRAMKRWPIAALIGGLSALALFACERERPKPEPAPPATPGASGPISPGAGQPGGGVDAIKEAPARYYGKTVRVAGEVDEIYNDRAFELEGTGWAFNDNITVLTKTPVRLGGEALAADEELVVVGTVRPFVAAEIKRDLGWDIGADVEVKLNKRPVLIAQSIQRVGEYGVWPEPAAGAAGPVTSTVMIVTMADPASLAGRKVDLGRERVQSVMGKGLWVGPSHMSQVYVVPSQPVKDIQAGQTVRVAGTLQKVPKDAVKTWDLPANMEGVVREESVFVDKATVTKVQ